MWDKYEGWRTWEPREELDIHGKRTGVVVEGEKYRLENLEHCPKLPLLIERLYSGETAIFVIGPKEIPRSTHTTHMVLKLEAH